MYLTIGEAPWDGSVCFGNLGVEYSRIENPMDLFPILLFVIYNAS